MTDRRGEPRYVRPGEMLAMDPGNLRRGPQGFFWLFADPPKRNERIGEVAIVHIRGELDHHASYYGESYEGLREKFAEAIAGTCDTDAYDSNDIDDDTDDTPDASPPKTVITCIDSPGGVVSGLNQTCAWMRKTRKEHPEIRFIVYVNEMAASAAYALACSMGDEIFAAPISSISGSIGVISTQVSQARKNKRDGYDVVLITSGERKADGHVHAPINEDAIAVERGRVETLAASFFKLVSRTRGLSVGKIEALQAGIFLSKDAKKRGLVDEIMSFDRLVSLAAEAGDDETGIAGGNKTDRRLGVSRATASSNSSQSGESDMTLKLDALIRRTEKAIAAEKDATKLAALKASLEAYKKTKHTIEKHESEEDDGEDADEEEEESSEKAPPDNDDDDDDKDDDSDDDDSEEEESDEEGGADEEEDEEEEEEEAKAALALVRQITGMKGGEARGALKAIAETAARTAKDVAKLKKDKRTEEKASLLASLKGHANKSEMSWLRDSDLKTVRGFARMRLKSGYVNVGDDQLIKPKHIDPNSEESLPETTRAMIDMAVTSFRGDDKSRAEFRSALVKNHIAALRAVNGATGRI